jgi:hypothetical protein
VREIEDIPIGGSSCREDELDEEEPSRGPYRWVMKIYESPKFPSLCADSIDVQADSICCVADEVWKSHIYNIRCAVEAMEHKEKFVVWVDYDFHHIKKDPKTQKVAVDSLNWEKKNSSRLASTTTGEMKDSIWHYHLQFKDSDLRRMGFYNATDLP